MMHAFFTGILAALLPLTQCQISLMVSLRLKGSPASEPIPYALSVLRGEPNDFDLSSIMMQDGVLRRGTGADRNLFLEDTIVALRRTLQVERGQHIFLGMRLYGLPDSDQDYFLLDATKVIDGFEHGFSYAVDTPSMSISMKAKMFRMPSKDSNAPCSCVGKECGCCEHLNVPKIELNETGCANITYLPDQYGFSLTFSLNGVIFYNNTISDKFSARNPPPVCFEVPHLKKYASLCLKFHDIDISQKVASGCIKFEAELYHMQVYEHEMGCFHIPVAPLSYRQRN